MVDYRSAKHLSCVEQCQVCKIVGIIPLCICHDLPSTSIVPVTITSVPSMTPPSLTVAAFLHLLYSGTQLPAQMFFHLSYKLNFIVHQTFVTTCRIKSTLQCNGGHGHKTIPFIKRPTNGSQVKRWVLCACESNILQRPAT